LSDTGRGVSPVPESATAMQKSCAAMPANWRTVAAQVPWPIIASRDAINCR
jgi:hypothetical protein